MLGRIAAIHTVQERLINQAKGFTLAAIGFAVSAAGFCLGHRWGMAAGMAGLALMYAALAYRAKARSGNPGD